MTPIDNSLVQWSTGPAWLYGVAAFSIGVLVVCLVVVGSLMQYSGRPFAGPSRHVTGLLLQVVALAFASLGVSFLIREVWPTTLTLALAAGVALAATVFKIVIRPPSSRNEEDTWTK